ncbi:LamG-like jellyroll fold domain-containing protein [Candidatus Nanohalovita haloferacivicina]|uniref:LamG-like jellyroll fold domain-containing protein n=1 Tax=Candidatus Nanohalovita haloferacivicina TaxID=2978046 RepID=UPI00325FD631|nr:hypothetical protein HBNXNv_0649 [Candidatus Nanohalobia archaeon BNXNv]
MRPNPRTTTVLLISGLLLLGAGISVQASNQQSLTGYFRLDNVSQAADSSGLGNDTVIEGRSILLNGSAITINSTPELQSTFSSAPFTMAFWIKHDDSGGGWDTVVSWTAENATGATKSARAEMANSNESIYTRWIAETNECGYNGGGFWARNRNMEATPGEWHLYTVTYDGTTIKEYTDGEVQDQGGPGCKLADMVSDLTIRDNIRPKIDDFRVYNRTLAESEVEKLYRGQEVDNTDLVLFQRFDEGYQGCHLYYERPCLFGDTSNQITATPNSFNKDNQYEGWNNDVPRAKASEGIFSSNAVTLEPENGIGTSSFSFENHSVSFWMKTSGKGRYTIFSNQANQNIFNESTDWRGDVEDLGAQDGFSDVRLANASSNGGFEDIFTGRFYQDDYPDFAGDENYLYLKYWAKTNSIPVWGNSWDSEWVRKPEPDPDKYQLYILGSDGNEEPRKEYYRLYYDDDDSTSFGYYADPEVYKRNPQMQLVEDEFRVYTGNYSVLDTQRPSSALEEWNNYVFRRSNGEIQLYINGEKTDSVQTPEMSISSISGFRPFSDYNQLSIDEIRIYNKTLSEAEIQDLAMK